MSIDFSVYRTILTLVCQTVQNHVTEQHHSEKESAWQHWIGNVIDEIFIIGCTGTMMNILSKWCIPVSAHGSCFAVICCG